MVSRITKAEMMKMIKFSYGKEDISALLPKRVQDSHKGTYGRVLIIGGSPCMAGAPCFSAKAAYRSGAGLVEIFTHEKNRAIIQTLVPEAVLTVWDGECPSASALSALAASLARADAVAIGMGLSQSAGARVILEHTLKERSCPIVIDADALNIIASDSSLAHLLGNETIITPHPLEASRLCSEKLADIITDIPSYAQRLANSYGAVCLLKDHNTAVASPHEDRVYINLSGNSGMSTGGSGDVLDGIIAGLIAQGKPIFEATCLAAYIHGLAGEAASAKLTEYSVMASDIADAISEVLLQSTKDR